MNRMNESTNTAPLLTLYFDGACAMCRAEVGRLRRWDKAGRLACVDITLPNFDPAPLGVDLAALNRELHGRTRDGRLLTGVDTLIAAYSVAGRGFLAWPLRVPLVRPLLAGGYRWFARHRYAISRLLGYRKAAPCARGACGVGNHFFR